MKKKNGLVLIGKFGSTYGIHGWIKVQAAINSNFLDLKEYFISENNSWITVKVENVRIHGKGFIVKLTHIHSPEEARTLTGKEIAIPRASLPKLKNNEYYWSDLEGLTVLNKDGAILGKVVYLLATGANDVLVVKGEMEFAIPYIPGQVILEVNLEQEWIKVDWEPL